jgi:hypothetical protein
MAGPKVPAMALQHVKDAITAGRYITARHFEERMGERNVNMFDVHTAIDRSIRAEPYPDAKPTNEGTCWRVIGPDVDGDRTLGLGVEVYAAPNRLVWITLCTVIELEEKSV